MSIITVEKLEEIVREELSKEWRVYPHSISLSTLYGEPYKCGFLSLYIEPLVGEKTIVNLMGDSRTKDEDIMLDSAECLRQYLRKLNRLSLSMERC
jgi:hypothetical protein